MKRQTIFAVAMLVFASQSSADSTHAQSMVMFPENPSSAKELIVSGVSRQSHPAPARKPKIMSFPVDAETPTQHLQGKDMIFLYTHAAEQGNAVAQFELGQLYLDGEILQQDHRKAMLWVTASAEQGLMQAQLLLSSMYLKGIGTDKDLEMARKWFNSALSLSESSDNSNAGSKPNTMVF